MKASRRNKRVLTYGLIGAIIGAVAFTVGGLFISSNGVSLVNGLVLGVVVGFVIGILPAAERDDGEHDRRVAGRTADVTGPADATLEGQEARDLDLTSESEPERGARR
jgi:hypothetical protein